MSTWYLGLETSFPTTSIALQSDRGDVLEDRVSEADSHSEALAPRVSAILARAGISGQNLAGITVGRGPGSFTGLRIGYAFAKGLAYGSSVPIHTISSLAAAAWEFRDRADMIYVLRDARREEFFFECFIPSSSNGLECISGPSIIPGVQILSTVEALCQARAIVPARCLAVSCDDLSRYEILWSEPVRQALGVIELSRRQSGIGETYELARLIAAEPLYLREVAAKSLKERGLR